MRTSLSNRAVAVALGAALVVAGLGLFLWAVSQLAQAVPEVASAEPVPAVRALPGTEIPTLDPASGVPSVAGPTEAAGEPRATATPQPSPAFSLFLAPDLPEAVREAAGDLAAEGTVRLGETPDPDGVTLDWEAEAGEAVYEEVFALAGRFDTIFPRTTGAALARLWQGEPLTTAETTYTRTVVLSGTLPALVQVLGDPGPGVVARSTLTEVVEATWADRHTLVLVPFEQLVPALVVFAVDGQNPVENAAHFQEDAYPLVARVYAHGPADRVAQVVAALQARIGPGNRDPNRLTVLAMTGVTALVRQTAYQMEQYGPAWVAEVVGPELAAADITHVSNEVPFVPDCVPNFDLENLTFCSPPEYMAALEAVGADIIGLTGNHQNDYGREAALQSLAIYAEAGLPVYGGGHNKEEAFAPLYLEHNGNRLAFLGANSYGPAFAWATDSLPGSAPFDLNILSATIRNIKQKDKADLVLVELQYQESYDVTPLLEQRQDFRALVRAGADIVTGVQSHVPQAVELMDGRPILYGLGNLFFDQMWSQHTREGLIVKHTFYRGRHISTQVLTTVLEDYGQPRWATDAEREAILSRVFGASYWNGLLPEE